MRLRRRLPRQGARPRVGRAARIEGGFSGSASAGRHRSGNRRHLLPLEGADVSRRALACPIRHGPATLTPAACCAMPCAWASAPAPALPLLWAHRRRAAALSARAPADGAEARPRSGCSSPTTWASARPSKRPWSRANCWIAAKSSGWPFSVRRTSPSNGRRNCATSSTSRPSWSLPARSRAWSAHRDEPIALRPLPVCGCLDRLHQVHRGAATSSAHLPRAGHRRRGAHLRLLGREARRPPPAPPIAQDPGRGATATSSWSPPRRTAATRGPSVPCWHCWPRVRGPAGRPFGTGQRELAPRGGRPPGAAAPG